MCVFVELYGFDVDVSLICGLSIERVHFCHCRDVTSGVSDVCVREIMCIRSHECAYPYYEPKLAYAYLEFAVAVVVLV